MSKGNRLKKMKKELNDKDVKVLQEIKITYDSNRNISVTGPINNPVLFMDLIAGAMKVVVDHSFSTAKLNADIEAGRKEKEKIRIIKP